MGELVAALRNFIVRDLLYVVGGSAVIISFLHVLDRLPDPALLTTPVLFLGAGVAYAVGYAVQDGLSLTPFFSTQPILKPGKSVKLIYKLFAEKDWVDVGIDDITRAYVTITAYAPEETLLELRRIMSLRQAGTTMGACSVICSVFLWTKARGIHADFDTYLATAVSILAILLWLLGWVKGAQETQYVRYLLPVAEVKRLKAEQGVMQ